MLENSRNRMMTCYRPLELLFCHNRSCFELGRVKLSTKTQKPLNYSQAKYKLKRSASEQQIEWIIVQRD